MASPDFSEYVDLTVYDTNAETLLNQIVSYGRSLIPEWQPAAGNVEMMLAEVFAVGAADLATYINRLPGGVVEGVLKLFGQTRSDGVKATANVTLTMVDNAGYTVPAGTAFGYITAGNPTYLFLLDEPLDIWPGSVSGSGAVTANTIGVVYNNVPASADVQVVSNASFISSAAVTAAGVSGGADAESDAVFFDRASNLFATYSSALVTTGQIKASILNDFASSVYRCQVFDKERYLDRTVASTVSHPGYVLVAMAGQNAINSTTNFDDVTLTAIEESAVRSSLEAKAPAGVSFDLMSAEVVSVQVTASVVGVPGSDPAILETAILAALGVYLDPNTWDLTKSHVRMNEIVALIDGVTGVDYVSSVSLAGFKEVGPGGPDNFTKPGADIVLTNLGTLVGNYGTHVLTVV